MFSFIRKKEEEFALRLLAYKYKKQGLPMPDLSVLKDQARQVVKQAHEITQKRGRNILSIMKEMVQDNKKS